MNRKWIPLAALAIIVAFFCLKTNPVPPDSKSAPLPASSPVSANPTSRHLQEWIGQIRSQTRIDFAEGRKLAEERREMMRGLMREDPAEAFRRSLSWSEWAALPEDIRAVVEQPFSATVDFLVLPSCAPREGAVNVIHPHRVVMNGESYNAYVYGTKAQMTSKEQLPARGILLDGIVVLAEGSFENLKGDDLKAAAEIFPRGSAVGVSWVSGRAAQRTILLGGALYDVASDEEEGALAETFLTAEKSLHPKSMVMAMTAGTAAAGTIAFSVDDGKKGAVKANSTWTETPKTALAVRISYSSAPTSYSYTLAELTNLVTACSNSVRTLSYGKTWLVPRVVTVNLPNAQAYYEANGPDSIVNDTRTQLLNAGINRDNYDIIIHAHPGTGGSGFGYAGLGLVGGGQNWLNGTVDNNVLTHEVGHNYGLGHAHFWAGITGLGSLGRTASDGSQVEREEYGDPYDVMGGGPLPAAHYTAHGKAALNWIEPKEVIAVVTNGIYRVHRFDHPNARTIPNVKLALKVVAPGGEEYWVSHRRLFTANTSMTRGACIERADGSGDQSLIDTTPLSRSGVGFGSDRDDAALAVGKSLVDSVGSVRITTIASAGTAPAEYLDVQVVFTEDSGSYSFYTTATLATNGLVGSYVNTDLRNRATQDDWRATAGVTISGRRVDSRLSFTSDGWGARGPVGLNGGTDANWENFSVQWDGYIVVRRPARLATTSDDSSRFWIDLNNNGVFASSGPEYVNNHWGTGQGPTRGDLSGIIPPGIYRVRIQYEEGNGGNYFTMSGSELPFQLFTTATRTTPGLTASFVATSLRGVFAQSDWRTSQTIAGSRVDAYPFFKGNGWGTLTSVGLSSANGTDGDWNNFSVQWDGFITNSAPLKLATISDDGSRIWIDVNKDGVFGASAPEYYVNGWGSGQGATVGAISAVVPPGQYAIRIQYEEGGGDNSFVLAGAPQLPVDATTLFNGLTFTGNERQSTSRKVAGDFTIQFWVRTAQIFGGDEDWTQGAALADAFDFGVTLGSGAILYGVGGATPATVRSGFIADGAWHHVSARRIQASGELTLFIDGIEVDRGTGGTELLASALNIFVGQSSVGSQGYAGNLDQFRIWDTARTKEQVLADFHSTRTGRWTDGAPLVRVAKLQPNSVQVFWDSISSFRILEGASSVNGTFVTLPTDQNSTNISFGATPMRYFRVRK